MALAVDAKPVLPGDVDLKSSQVSVVDIGSSGDTTPVEVDEDGMVPVPEPTNVLHCTMPNVADDSIRKDEPTVEPVDYDMLIIGAGISGINMAYRAQTMLRGKSYVILERRKNMGGTWDLMRYPGIRSDSDLYTFGFAWRPWNQPSPIAQGGLIVKYMKECAAATGIDKHILYEHRVVNAHWHSPDQAWTLEVEVTNEDGSKQTKYFRGTFMVLGTGYYDYDVPLQTIIPGLETFKGQVIHPQFWPEDLDYADKTIAVIGSGATAVTLIPALAQKAKKVTMVQRSPSYIVSLPNRARPKPWWERLLPQWLQHRITRWRFLLMGFFYRRFLSGNSDQTRLFLQRITTAQLPKHIPYDPHFKPRYAPWTQRMCLCPDGDFFRALHSGRADVATGIIRSVTPTGIELEVESSEVEGESKGDEQEQQEQQQELQKKEKSSTTTTIEADIIITATGLRMKYGGNAAYYIDGERLNWGSKYLWRGVMIQDVPNMAIVQGYTKASWTLGADATAHMVVRMVRHLDWHGFASATPRVPRRDGGKITRATGVMGLTSTYIMTALHRLPRTTDEAPWKGRGNYLQDIWDAKYSSINKGMQFTKVAYE